MGDILSVEGRIVGGEENPRKKTDIVLRGETLGRGFTGDFSVVFSVIREASSSDTATRNQLIRGFSSGVAEKVFPGSDNDEDPMNEAQGEFAIGVWRVLQMAASAVKQEKAYMRLGIQFLHPQS